jgi:hypothetical protein
MKLLGVVFVIVMTTAASAGLYFPRPDLINQQSAACRPDFDNPPRCLASPFDSASQDPRGGWVLSPGAGFLPQDGPQSIGRGPDTGVQAGSMLQQAWLMPQMSAR